MPRPGIGLQIAAARAAVCGDRATVPAAEFQAGPEGDLGRTLNPLGREVPVPGVVEDEALLHQLGTFGAGHMIHERHPRRSTIRLIFSAPSEATSGFMASMTSRRPASSP